MKKDNLVSRRKEDLRMLVLQELKHEVFISFSLNRFYQGDWVDSISSRFVDELPEKYIKKINNYEKEKKEIFEFNQDLENDGDNYTEVWLVEISKKTKMISTKIKRLRRKFNIYNIDGYVVPKNDSYFNEFSSPDRLKLISNFDGSAGLAIILRNKNYLFIDGRYTIQAKSQSGANFDVVEIHKKLPWKVLKHKIKIGYNPYCFTNLSLSRYFKNYFKLVPIYNDLISEKKSRKVNNKFYFIKDYISGESAKSKINKVLKYLRKDKSDCLFITAPENVAWLLNLRGRDNPHSPIPNCRLILKNNGEIYLFVNKSKTQNLPFKKLLKINIIDEDKINIFLNNFVSKKIILDRLSCSIAYINLLKNKTNISNKNDPIYNMKSIKNDIEIKNFMKIILLMG